MEVVVVGGGVAGLVAARRLAAAGTQVRVFEREPTVGGRVGSDVVEGFTLDHGFQVLFTAYPAARRELDFDGLDLRYFTPGATICRTGHRSVFADPLRAPGTALESVCNRDIPMLDKLRLLRLTRDLRRRDPAGMFPGEPVDIRTYLVREGFSEQFIERFAAPFYGGITLDRSLSTAAGVFTYTLSMLANGHAAVPASGMGAIPSQLAKRARDAGATIETNSPVGALYDEPPGPVVHVGGQVIEPDAVVLATDPSTAATFTEVSSIPTEGRGAVTQYFALEGKPRLATGKRLLLHTDGNRPNHVVPISTVAPSYAPDDATLLAASFLDDAVDEPEERLAAATRETLSSWFPERSFEGLRLLATYRTPFAQFAQPPGIHKTLPDADAPAGRVFLAGEYTQWSSIQGALRSGRVAAEHVRAASL